jgi:hypothetical protein
VATTTEGYVGRIVVTKTQKTEESQYRNGVQERNVARNTVEVLDVTVRADTEYGVRAKLTQALELLESGDLSQPALTIAERDA